MDHPVNVLITGAGGAAAVSLYKAYATAPNITCFMADIDPYAAGLYLVPQERRILLPRGDHKAFVPVLLHACQNNGIDVLIPTVEAEMMPIAQYLNLFALDGTKVMMCSIETLQKSLDKWTLIQTADGIVPTPQTALFDAHFDPEAWTYPVVLKPRRGSGSNGIHILKSAHEFEQFEPNGSHVVQEFLPGPEYSVDVLATPSGKVMAAVPRERLKIDSGIAVAARVRKDERLSALAAQLATATGLTFCANIQFRLDANGLPKLLEMNPRFPGTMPLTIAAGINMPLLCLKALYDYRIQKEDCLFHEIAVVRYLQEVMVPPAEMEILEREKAYTQNPARMS